MATYLLSQPLSLDFCERLIARLDQDFDAKESQLAELALPREATCANYQLIAAQNEELRRSASDLMARQEDLLSVQSLIRLARDRKAFEEGLVYDEQGMRSLQRTIDMLQRHVTKLPRRQPVEQELANISDQLQQMQRAGHGENVNAERQRLRAITRNLPVMGQEDFSDVASYATRLQAIVDEGMENIRAARLGMKVRVPFPAERYVPQLLTEFGVKFEEVVEPEPAPAEMPEQPLPAV